VVWQSSRKKRWQRKKYMVVCNRKSSWERMIMGVENGNKEIKDKFQLRPI
jgi:hypothetical protein